MRQSPWQGIILKSSDAAFTTFLMVTGQRGTTLDCFYLTSGADDDAIEKNPRERPWTVELTPDGKLPARTEISVRPIFSTFIDNVPKPGKQGKRRYYREDAYED